MTADSIDVLSVLRGYAVDIVAPVTIAARTGRTRGAVANWWRRYPDLIERAEITGSNTGTIRLFWWPAVREWLVERKIRFGEPLTHPQACISCGRNVLAGELAEAVVIVQGDTVLVRHFDTEWCQSTTPHQPRVTPALDDAEA